METPHSHLYQNPLYGATLATPIPCPPVQPVGARGPFPWANNGFGQGPPKVAPPGNGTEKYSQKSTSERTPMQLLQNSHPFRRLQALSCGEQLTLAL